MTDLNTEAALCCMIVSNPAGGERPHAWQKRVNDLIRAQRDTITALRQREAEAVAGAIEAAEQCVFRARVGEADNDLRSIIYNIRALHTDATRAALDRAKAEGMRDAANICDELAIGYANHKGVPLALSDARRDILAAADKLEGK